MDSSKLFGVGDWVSFGHKEIDGEMVATREGWVESVFEDLLLLRGVRDIGSSMASLPDAVETVSVYDCFPQGENEFFELAEIECVELLIESRDGEHTEEITLAPRTPIFFDDFGGDVTVSAKKKKMLLSEFVLSSNSEFWNDDPE